MRALSLLLGVATLFLATHAHALSGTLSACFVYSDIRDECDDGSGSQHTCVGGNRPLVGARVVLVGGGGGSIGESTTATNGCASIGWDDWLAFFWPVQATLRIEMKDPSDFYVTNQSGALFTFSTPVSIPDGSHSAGTFTTGSAEQALVFATASEYWSRLVANSSKLSSRMTNVRISARGNPATENNGCAAGFSCLVDANHVVIVDTHGRTRPVTVVAHEIGHATHAHALQLFDLSISSSCTSQHDWTTIENEKFAFMEGTADFFALAFAWSKNTALPLFPPGNPVENPTVCGTTPWRVEGCIASALWDLHDDPANDDDLLDDSANPEITFATIINTFDEYAGGTGDRQAEESARTCAASNHFDFLFNFDQHLNEDASSLTGAVEIYEQIGLVSGEEEHP